jgi:putative DNA-invertase from lambdoid prophage Rac
MSLTFLYARVSTSDQTAVHQEKQARRAGYQIDEVFADEGVSGVSAKFAERTEAKRLMDKVRRGDIVVCRFFDRLGRNFEDVCQTVRWFMDKGVIIKSVIDGQTFGGKNLSAMDKAIQNALLGFIAAAAQSQAETTKAAQKAGIAHARESDPNAYRGKRPMFTREKLNTVLDLASQGHTNAYIARETKLLRSTVFKLRNDPAAAERVLAKWEM